MLITYWIQLKVMLPYSAFQYCFEINPITQDDIIDMYVLAHGHLNNKSKSTGVHLGPCRDPLDDPRVSSDPLKAEPVAWLLPQQSRDQVLGLGGQVGWEPQVNLIHKKCTHCEKVIRV